MINLEYEEQIKEFILNGDFGNLIIQKNIRQNFSEKTCDLIKKILVQNPNERPTIDEIIQKCKDIFDNDIKNQKFYNNNPFFKFQKLNSTKTPQIVEINEDSEKYLANAITSIINEGFKIFKKNVNLLNIKGESNNYTPELFNFTTNKFKESNRPPPPLPHQIDKNSEENYFLFTHSSKMKKSNRNNENNKGEGNNNDRVEKYEISNYCLLK